MLRAVREKCKGDGRKLELVAQVEFELRTD